MKIENRARDVRNQLDSLELRWESKMNALRNTPEWKEYCKTKGIHPSYTFGDILA